MGNFEFIIGGDSHKIKAWSQNILATKISAYTLTQKQNVILNTELILFTKQY